MVDSQSSDYIIMILSSDWAESYLKDFIPSLNDDRSVNLVKKCARETVIDFMSKSISYINIDHAPDRVNKSRSKFFGLLKGLDKSTLHELNKLFEELKDGKNHQDLIWMINQQISGLINGLFVTDHFDEKELSILKNTYSEIFDTEIDFQSEARSSQTEWDKYLVSINPEVPSYLADFATLNMLDLCLLKKYLIRINQLFNREQMNRLKDWIQNNSSSLVGNNIRFDWSIIFSQ